MRERYGQALGASELHAVQVIVSELVTNAVVHGRGSVRLRLTADRDVISGEVIDEGSGFEAEVRERGAEEVSGRGLSLVAALTGRWGIHAGSSHVWFQLDRDSSGDEEIVSPEIGIQTRPDELP